MGYIKFITKFITSPPPLLLATTQSVAVLAFIYSQFGSSPPSNCSRPELRTTRVCQFDSNGQTV